MLFRREEINYKNVDYFFTLIQDEQMGIGL